jgi:hypothetical protein
VKRPVRIPSADNCRSCEWINRLSYTFEPLVDAQTSLSNCPEQNLACAASVFQRIVSSVLDAKMSRQICQAVASLGKNGPRPPHHLRRIKPTKLAMWQTVSLARTQDGDSVKCSVTNNNAALQGITHYRINLAPTWRRLNVAFVDPVNRNVDRVKVVLGVNQRLPRTKQAVVSEGRYADLADA